MLNILKEFFITQDFTLFIIFLGVYVLYLLKNKVFKKFVSWVIKKTPTTLDDELYPLVSKLITIIIFGSGIILALSNLGVNTETILTACGAGTLAFALAVKDTIANILAGFILIIDKPFKVGDDIRFSFGDEAKVLNIGLRRSKFLKKDKKKSILIIRNLDLVKDKVYNYSMVKRVK